jgi:hypothetical protein
MAPIAEGALHPLIAVWRGKASAANDEYNRGTGGASRQAYLSGKADAYEEAADALEALLQRRRPADG